MKFGRLGTELKHGYNAMTTRESDMLMDIGYQVMDANEIIELEDPFQESAIVILTGEVEIRWDDTNLSLMKILSACKFLAPKKFGLKQKSTRNF